MDGNATKRHIAKRDYAWILAVDNITQRPVILGPYDSESEANRVGFEKITDGQFQVFMLSTRNRVMARDLLKYKRFDQTAKLEETLKRAKYQV